MARKLPDRSNANWPEIERLYREGGHTNRVLAAEYGASESAIRKRAAAHGWVKNERAQVRSRALEKADAASVPQYLELPSERIEALAQVGADILTSHRMAAVALKSLTLDLLGQLHHQTHNADDLAEVIREHYEVKAANNPLLAGVYKQQCNMALHAIGLNGRSKTLVNLGNVIEKVTKIEREAWNLNNDNDTRGYEDLLAEIATKAGQPAAAAA